MARSTSGARVELFRYFKLMFVFIILKGEILDRDELEEFYRALGQADENRFGKIEVLHRRSQGSGTQLLVLQPTSSKGTLNELKELINAELPRECHFDVHTVLEDPKLLRALMILERLKGG